MNFFASNAHVRFILGRRSFYSLEELQMTIYHLLFNRPTLLIINFSVLSVAGNVSIKNNKLCETNPISKTPKMNITHYITNRYDDNSGLLQMQKQSQTNPIYPERSRTEQTQFLGFCLFGFFIVSLSNLCL